MHMKEKNVLSYSLFCFMLVLTFGCDKDEDCRPEKDKQIIVHLAGESFDGDTYRAAYWRNGSRTFLQPPGGDGLATSLKVKDGDVYIAGIDFTSNPYKAVLWKNSTVNRIIDGSVNNYDVRIEFSGVDLYSACSQWDGDEIAYYKNNTKAGTIEGQLNALCVVGNDVYISGNYRNPLDENSPVYPMFWKNGVGTTLFPAQMDVSATATDIFVNGNDVYVCGFIDHKNPSKADEAFLWKNGTLTILPSAGNAKAIKISLHGNDVFIAGYSSETIGGPSHATYWKNGSPVVLDNSTKNSTLSDLAISEKGKIYAAGNLGDAFNATVWIDGVVDGIMNGSPIGAIYCIALEEY